MDEYDRQLFTDEPPYGQRSAEKMIAGKYFFRGAWMEGQRYASGSEPYSDGILRKLRDERREYDDTLSLKTLCKRFNADLNEDIQLPDALAQVWRNACGDWRVGSLCSLGVVEWETFAKTPIAGKLHYQLLSFYESDFMEGFDPFVLSGYGITRLLKNGDKCLHNRAIRAGRHIGTMLKVMAGDAASIKLVADGTIIRELGLMREAVNSALDTIKAEWHLLNEASIVGAAWAALNSRPQYVYSIDAPQTGETAMFGGKSAMTHHMRRAVGDLFQGGFAVSVDAADADDDELAGQLGAVPRFYGENTLYAVRSSATVEDNERCAFPGQFKSCLDVPAGGLLEAVRVVQRSVYRENVAAYCRQNNIDAAGVKMGVLIMPMVGKAESAVSGAIFTVNPETGRDEIYISACKGWGEAEMAGKVTPELAVVSRRGEIMHVKPSPSYTDYLLDNEKRLRLEEAAVKVEDAMRKLSPTVRYADIEYVINGGDITLVQARPETAGDKRSGSSLTVSNAARYQLIASAGFAASRGTAGGRAVYCASVEESGRLTHGDILLCDETTSTWEANMRKARAIVTAYGGANSHTAVCARELGIPAIVGVGEGVMAELRKREEITVDATARKIYAGTADGKDLAYASGEPDYGHTDDADEAATLKNAIAAGQIYTDGDGVAWIGKPREKTAAVLQEVHRRSHTFITGEIGLAPVRDIVKDGIYYVLYKDIHGFRERLRGFTDSELAGLLRRWDAAMDEYAALSERIDGTDQALDEWFASFIKVNGWMNLSFPLYMVCAGRFEQALADRKTPEPYFTRAHHSVPPGTPLNWAQQAVVDYIALFNAGTEAAVEDYALRYRFLPSYSIEFDAKLPVAELREKIERDKDNIPVFHPPEVEEFYVNDDAFLLIHRNMQTATCLKESSHHIKLYGQRLIIAKYGATRLSQRRLK
jgi:phosphohistidine swiveling domain-containing protein